MTTIQLNSDGYSFHTMELKIHPDRKTFKRALAALYAASEKAKNPQGTTYPIKRFQNNTRKPHCSTLLSNHGILLYLTKTRRRNRSIYTIKAVVNPRKVLEPKAGYLGIAPTDSISMELFQDEFTTLMRKYHLPEFLDEWKLTRLDLCVNLQLNKKKTAREFCRLLQKDLLPSKLERVFFYDPMADAESQRVQKEADKHSICLENGSYSLVVYDKLYQFEAEDLADHETWRKLPDGILRLELRCYKEYLDKVLDKKELALTSEQIYWLAQHSRELILKKFSKAFSGGIHYKPTKSEEIIKDSQYHKATRRQLRWLVNRTRYAFNLQQLERGMKKKFGIKPRTVAKRLEQLEKLDINLVPLRKDFYLSQMPSLPLILEMLEDDFTELSISKDGVIEY